MTTHYQNPYLPHAARTGVPPEPKPRPPAPHIATDHEGLPIGTAVQVMAWVDDDPDRAMRFLLKEQKESRPRVSLVASLTAVLKRNGITPPKPEEPAAIEAPEPVAEIEAADEGEVDPLALVRERLQVE